MFYESIIPSLTIYLVEKRFSNESKSNQWTCDYVMTCCPGRFLNLVFLYFTFDLHSNLTRVGDTFAKTTRR